MFFLKSYRIIKETIFFCISTGNVGYISYFSCYSYIFLFKVQQKQRNTSSSLESFPHDSETFSPVSAFTLSKAVCRPGDVETEQRLGRRLCNLISELPFV